MTVPTSQSAWHGWRLFAVLAVAVLCMTALVLALQAQPVEGLRSAIRATARSSFALFLAAFSARPRRWPAGSRRTCRRQPSPACRRPCNWPCWSAKATSFPAWSGTA